MQLRRTIKRTEVLKKNGNPILYDFQTKLTKYPYYTVIMPAELNC